VKERKMEKKKKKKSKRKNPTTFTHSDILINRILVLEEKEKIKKNTKIFLAIALLYRF